MASIEMKIVFCNATDYERVCEIVTENHDVTGVRYLVVVPPVVEPGAVSELSIPVTFE